MIYLTVIFSFLFESVITNIINLDSILIPLFLLTSFSILYPYCKNKIFFVSLCIICGLVYDIYIDTLFINTISYGICSLIVLLIYNYLKYNIYSANFINIISIIVFRIVSFLLLCLMDVISFDFSLLIVGLYSSLIINLIYGLILYIIVNLLSKILNIKRYI